MNIVTIQNMIEHRQIKWLFNIINNPDDNVMLRAAVSGTMKVDTNNETLITPWIEELALIITKLDSRCKTNIDIYKLITEHKGIQWIWSCRRLLDMDPKLILETIDEREINTAVTMNPEVTSHRTKYATADELNKYVCGNTCPMCSSRSRTKGLPSSMSKEPETG